MSKNKHKKSPKEDLSDPNFDQLLKSYTEDAVPTSAQRVLYFIQGLMVALVPISIYSPVFSMNLLDYGALFGIVSVVVACVISLAYHNVTFFLLGQN